MRNKIFAAVFSFIFLFMLIGAPLTLFLTEKGILEYNNVGNKIVADKTYDDSTAFGKFFNGIEKGKVAIKDTYINNLPFFLNIVNTYKPLKSSLSQSMINWLQNKGNELYVLPDYMTEDKDPVDPGQTEDPDVPKVDMVVPEPETTPDEEGMTYSASLKTTDGIFRHYAITGSVPGGPNKTTYVRIVKLDREVLYENMLKVVDLVNALVEKDRNVNWYFYLATTIESTEIGTKILPQESTLHIYKDFTAKVDPSVKVGRVVVNSFNDYFNKFYMTDHHWNCHGSEEAYLGIVQMLHENYPDVEPYPVEQVYEFNKVRFFGSLSRTHANYNLWDSFGIYYRNLPEHTVKRDTKAGYGATKSQPENLEVYKNEKHNTAQGYNHYTEFYRIAKEISYPENNTGRNLLLIGDSYSIPLQEQIAVHFDNTYVRYEDKNWNNLPEDLYYDEFIKEHNITDVIVLEEISKCIMEGYGSAYPCGFLNIFPDSTKKW